jgi:hypothetical protein
LKTRSRGEDIEDIHNSFGERERESKRWNMSGGVAIFDRDMAVSIHLLDKLMDLKTRRSYDAAGQHLCEEWVERTKHQRMANGFWREGEGSDIDF